MYPSFFFQAEDGIRDRNVTGVQTCALPISRCATAGDLRQVAAHQDGVQMFAAGLFVIALAAAGDTKSGTLVRSEEHTSELQSRFDLVCRLLLEKKKKIKKTHHHT